jgi:uncharacterized protein YcnI
MATGALLLLGNIVEAHTTISPRESVAGAMVKYTVRVPAEGKMMSKGAEVEVPEGVTVANFATPAGWTYDANRQDGRVVAIHWHMDINPGEFAEFSFVARNPKDSGQLIWKLREFFADGTVTDYTNGPDGIYPRAIVKVTPN